MTEKSEDQVVWVCPDCHFTTQNNKGICERYGKDHEIAAIQYIPHSQYLALKYDLAKAVEALEDMAIGYDENGVYFDCEFKKKAKEALGKIGGKV